jgi:2-dehydro-3-deoxyphosphooctonate aldolase (KDO 8-P synthase)
LSSPEKHNEKAVLCSMNFAELQQGPFFILGPCVIENQTILDTVATELARLKDKYQVHIIFKASFDKANRTSVEGYRGPGMREGLEMLADIKHRFGFPLITDIHESYQADIAAEYVDILQIPAFLCRQTDLLLAAGNTGKIVNIKKAQFLSGQDMKFPVEKVKSTGNNQIMLTERGTMFGYNNLVVDFRNLPDMAQFGFPVIMDCTHSVQRPGAGGGKTIGNREFVPSMALAAKAFGANGYFLEVHPDPDNAPSDGANMLYLQDLEALLVQLIA